MKLRQSLLAIAVLTAAGSLALTGCSTGGTDAGGDTGSTASSGTDAGTGSGLKTVVDGKLTVCSDIPYEPFESMKDGKAVGFDIDITAAIAEDLGLELNVVDSSFDAITSGLFKTDCDIAASSISITDERKQNVDFSDPYYDDDLVLIAKKDSGITSIDTAKGKDIGVQTATTGEAYGQENGLSTIGYEDSGLQIQSLKSGATAGSLGNQSVLKFAIKGESDFEVVEEIKTGEQLGIAVPKGNADMLAAVNKTLGELKSSGDLDKLEAEWFGN
ncbi:MAG: ABC transporter substrate-binding protein [Microbacterium sp.]|jgi:polar amino acid transport system substrate-binding protein|nr:ABC transporter substrate-binding protein [Microbacterium sp.]